MRLSEIYESLVQPEISNDSEFAEDPSSMSEYDRMEFGIDDQGAFAYKRNLKDNPHEIEKISRSSIAVISDKYWQYVDYLLKHDLMDNPYFPNIYNVEDNYKSNKDGALQARARIEKLDHFNSLNSKEAQYLAEKIFGINAASNDIYTYKNLYVIFAEATFLPDEIEILDENFIEAKKYLHRFAREYYATFDLSINNIMVRRTPYGPQLVFSDPFV